MASGETSADVLGKLDTIISILQMAYKAQIDQARAEINADPVAALVLEMLGSDGMEAGDLQSKVAIASKQSKRTIQRRLSSLVAQGVLAQSGSGPPTRYRSTNLL
jgi:bifunctional ADP-heptose synthase (sugar kinase/adenylyltransferase)